MSSRAAALLPLLCVAMTAAGQDQSRAQFEVASVKVVDRSKLGNAIPCGAKR
jgi:hypothetical protein